MEKNLISTLALSLIFSLSMNVSALAKPEQVYFYSPPNLLTQLKEEITKPKVLGAIIVLSLFYAYLKSKEAKLNLEQQQLDKQAKENSNTRYTLATRRILTKEDVKWRWRFRLMRRKEAQQPELREKLALQKQELKRQAGEDPNAEQENLTKEKELKSKGIDFWTLLSENLRFKESCLTKYKSTQHPKSQSTNIKNDYEELAIPPYVSPFSVLNVPDSATSDKLKRSYKRLATLIHNDKNKSFKAKEQFQLLNNCYDVLTGKEEELRNQSKS